MSHLPAVRDSMLFTTPHEAPVQVETEHWFDWLREARSFTFAGIAGPFTARHEERSGRHFWYAYRQQDGVLHKTYLGRSPELTLQRLEQAAQALANAGSKSTRDDSSGEYSSAHHSSHARQLSRVALKASHVHAPSLPHQQGSAKRLC